MRMWLFPLMALVTLSGCGKPEYEDQVSALVDFLHDKPIGISPDYWLVKASSFGSSVDRVALVFGLLDDFTFCLDLANLYMSKYPADRYTCMPANY